MPPSSSKIQLTVELDLNSAHMQPYGMHIRNVTSSTDRYSIFQLHSRVHTHTHTLGSGVYANARSYQTPWSMSSDLHTDTHTH